MHQKEDFSHLIKIIGWLVDLKDVISKPIAKLTRHLIKSPISVITFCGFFDEKVFDSSTHSCICSFLSRSMDFLITEKNALLVGNCFLF